MEDKEIIREFFEREKESLVDHLLEAQPGAVNQYLKKFNWLEIEDNLAYIDRVINKAYIKII